MIVKRLVGETVRIGKDVAVTIVTATRGRVELNVQAPKDRPITREPKKEEKPR